jgi:hypothetical protein
MNWVRIAIAGVAAGVATTIIDFVQHGMIMGPTYQKLDTVFSQTQANPGWFVLVAVVICFFAALLFARTRGSWAPGWKGGLVYGFFLGLVVFFQGFYDPLVIDGYPYYLSWCEGGMAMIDSLAAGAVAGAIIPA